jgi:hypothetical protein
MEVPDAGIVPLAEIREIFERFSKDQLWAQIDKRLSCFFYRKYGQEPLLNCEELIQKAKLDLWEGRKHWRPEKASLVTCLCGAIRSNASHILEKENPHRHHLCPIEEIAETEFVKKAYLPTYLEVCDYLRHVTSGDAVLTRMIEFRINEADMKPREILEAMPDLSEKEFRKAYRRLNKLIERLKKEQENGSDS